MAEKKYEFTGETREVDGRTVKRIRALRDVHGYVKKGNLGGWITDDGSLSHDDTCWVHCEASVLDKASVRGSAVLYDQARLTGHAVVGGEAHVGGRATVSDWAYVGGNAYIADEVEISNHGIVDGSTMVCGKAKVRGSAHVIVHAHVSGNAVVEGNAVLHTGTLWDGATIRSRNDVIVVTGFLEEAFTVYRADGATAGHVLVAGCQRLTLDEGTERLMEIARCNGWHLPPGWRGLRAALMVTVRGWKADAVKRAEAVKAAESYGVEPGDETK